MNQETGEAITEGIHGSVVQASAVCYRLNVMTLPTRRSTSTNPDDGAWIGVAEAARLMGMSHSTVCRWIESGRLPATRVGPKSIRINRRDVIAAMSEVARPIRDTSSGTQVAIRGGAADLERRRDLVQRILANRERRVIAPRTASGLVAEARRLNDAGG